MSQPIAPLCFLGMENIIYIFVFEAYLTSEMVKIAIEWGMLGRQILPIGQGMMPKVA